MKNKRKPKSNDIAIVGMACRFPEANDHRQFWENLKNGVKSIREIPPDRWDVITYDSPDFEAPKKNIRKLSGFLDNVDRFDHRFFDIAPSEASHICMEQRLLLEECLHCIEDSGVPLDILQERKTAVYMGILSSNQSKQGLERHTNSQGYTAVGAYSGMTANRVSSMFGLRGPSYAVDADCASSLVAIDCATKTLLTNESDFALAGGISLHTPPFRHLSFSRDSTLSPDDPCETFDTKSDNFVFGEGVGVLLLQRLSDAVKDGNYIYGIVKGTAVDHMGRSSMCTAPKAQAQAKTIAMAYEDAGVSPESVTYLEAHSTGASWMDPMALAGLKQAFGRHTDKKEFCKIGSVNTNIGDTVGAAGIAGVIKALLMMRYQKIPATLNLEDVNRSINFKDTPFSPATKLTEWNSASGNKALVAGVSSFGLGGTNCHVVLEAFKPNSAAKTIISNQKTTFYTIGKI